MELVCKTCKKPFNAHPGEIASAAIDYTFGRKHTFICDHCKAENILTKAEYEAVKDAKPGAVAPAPVKPVVAPKPMPKPAQPVAKPAVAKPAPVVAKPMPVAPKPMMAPVAPQPREGVVLVASLHVRKDHSTSSETVAGLVKGEKVKIVSTWTDGKNTWAQLGPDRWAAIEHNGKTMIEVPK